MIAEGYAAEPTKELQTQWPTNGAENAYRMGIKAGQEMSMSNPTFSTYGERIAYRNGWMEGRKLAYCGQAPNT